MTMKLVLASGSQRRRELLTMCGYDYEIIVSNADETIDENDPESFVRALSFRKAKDVFDRLFAAGRRDFAVIGSDTVVAFQKEGEAKPVIIGKPKDAEDAVRILSMLSGKTHRVFTGVSVIADIPDENAAAQCSIQEKAEIQNKIEKLKISIDTKTVDEEKLINSLIKKFKTTLTISREILCDLIDRIEIDENKKVYIYFKFKTLNKK